MFVRSVEWLWSRRWRLCSRGAKNCCRRGDRDCAREERITIVAKEMEMHFDSQGTFRLVPLFKNTKGFLLNGEASGNL